MEKTVKVAVPTEGAAGLDAMRSAHFGHCPRFTVVELSAQGEVVGVSEVVNPPHEQGGCMGSVNALAAAGVDVVVAAGMGMNPLLGCQRAGITVLYEASTPLVGDVVRKVVEGAVPVMSPEAACSHHHG